MNEGLQRLMRLALPWRIVLLLALSLMVLALGWLVVLLPQQQTHTGQERQLMQQTQLEQQRQQQLALHPPVADLLAEISALQQPATSRPPQLLEALLAARGAQLEAWQPESQPQHIVLKLDWQQFTPLFAELAHTALPVPERFQLQADQGTLMTQLWLESSDEG